MMTWEGDKLVHKQTWNGKESVITRYVDEQDHFVMVNVVKICFKCESLQDFAFLLRIRIIDCKRLVESL